MKNPIIPFLNESLNKTILEEVFKFFIRGNETEPVKIKITDEVVKAFIESNTEEYYRNMRNIEKTNKTSFYLLNFYDKARIVLPIIFDISIEDCRTQLLGFMTKAHCTLALKRNSVVYGKRINEDEAYKIAKRSLSRIPKNQIYDLINSLKERLTTSNPENDPEYINAVDVMDREPDSAFDHGHFSDKFIDARAYVESKDRIYNILKNKLTLNEKYLEEIRFYDDEMILIVDDLIMAPSIFEEMNIGFDISKLKIRQAFAKQFAKQIGTCPYIEDLDQWEYEMIRSTGHTILRKTEYEQISEYEDEQPTTYEEEDE